MAENLTIGTVRCRVGSCTNTFTGAGVTPSTTYACRYHTDDELKAAGVIVRERKDKEVHFQDHAFDKDLNRAPGIHFHTNTQDEVNDLPHSSWEAAPDLAGEPQDD